MRRAADIIRERNPELARLETLDTGKPLQETLVADWPSGADALEWFATAILKKTKPALFQTADEVEAERKNA